MLCRFERSIVQSQNGYCVFSYVTKDTKVPEAARSKFHHDNKIHITAVGYYLPASDADDVKLPGTWLQSRYGLELMVHRFEPIAPQETARSARS